MFLLEKQDLNFYYQTKQHFDEASLPGTSRFTRMALADSVIDTRKNEVIKCRVQLDFIFGTYYQHVAIGVNK